MAAGVDFVEVDLWLEGNRFVARHERRLGPFPFLYDKWYIKPSFGRPFTLADVAAEPVGLFLDLRGDRDRLLEPLLAALEELKALGRTILTSQDWKLLDRAREREPRLRLAYSAGYERQVGPLRRRLQADPPAMVSIRHVLLDATLIGDLKERGVMIIAWTVDDRRRARELLRWQVDGIVSNDLSLLRDLA